MTIQLINLQIGRIQNLRSEIRNRRLDCRCAGSNSIFRISDLRFWIRPILDVPGLRQRFLLSAAKTYRGSTEFRITKVPGIHRVVIRWAANGVGSLIQPAGASNASISSRFGPLWILFGHEEVVTGL